MALSFYAVISYIFLARGASLTHAVWGRGSDPFIFIWSFAWWPYAISHHLPLLHTNLLWRPVGVFTFWVTSVPLLALLASPVTLTAGPVVAYNLLVLAAPVLTAFVMHRVCLRLGAGFWPALAGGYLAGFSTYQMAQAGTLNLAFTVFVPVAVWVVVARAQGGIGRGRSVALLALALVGQMLVSTEIFALAALFGGLFWVLAAVLVPAWRALLLALLADAALAGVLAAVVLAPALVSMLTHARYLHMPALWPPFFSADLFGAVVPGGNTWLGGAAARGMINFYFGDVSEQDSYLGCLLVLIVYGFVRRNWGRPEIRFLALAVLAVTVFSLGPNLWVLGHYTSVAMPWAVMMHLPFMGDVLPARFALFAALGVAILASLSLREAGPASWLAMLAAGILLLPAPHARQPVPDAAFFAPGRVQAVLGPSPQLLVLPFAINGPASYWQVENRFGFSQSGGYLGFPPAAMQAYPAVQELFGGRAQDFSAADFTAFARGTGAQFVVAGPGTPAALIARVKQLGWPMRRVDDVTVFTVPARGGG